MPTINRFTTTTNGAMIFTGNTLGLSGPRIGGGQIGTIRAFTTLDLASQVPGYPPGTTTIWQDNESQAQLIIPPGSTILYAELQWGGTSISANAGDVSAFIDTDITFTTPLGTTTISPDPATADEFTFNSGNGPNQFYSRSNDVTALIQASGSGTYSVSGVPAIVAADSNAVNAAGWTLGIIYENPALPVRNMSIYSGLDAIVGTTIDIPISGFLTPSTGTVDARVLISAMEGDPGIPGDQLLFGPDVGSLTNLSGPNNLTTNFFASQINDGDSESATVGQLDTSGTFGTLNSTPGVNPPQGVRQGWDVTNVLASNLGNNDTTAVLRLTTEGDAYAVPLIGLQIDAVELDFGDAPDISAGNGAGDYSTLLANNGPRHGIQNQVLLGSLITAELDALQNSDATGDDIPQNIQDDGVATPLPILRTNDSTYSLTVDVTNNSGSPANLYGWVDFNQDGIFQVNEAVPVEVILPAPGIQQVVLNFTVPFGVTPNVGDTFARLRVTTDDLQTGGAAPEDEDPRSLGLALDGEVEDYILAVQEPSADISVVKSDSPDPVIAGETLTYSMVVANAGPSDAEDVVLSDAIPGCVLSPEYSLDGGVTWNLWTGSINLGTITVGGSETVLIRGVVDPSCTGTITNTATVDSITPDPDPSNNTSTVDTTINTSADIRIVKSDSPDPVIAGETLTYTMVIFNAGPSDALDVVLSDAIPACVLSSEYSLDGGITWNLWPGSVNLGTLSAGASVTVLIRGVVDPSCTGTITNTATVDSITPDPDPSNNTSTVDTTINTSADIRIVKSDSPDPVIAGETLTYSMVIFNAGPSDALDVVLSDAIPACVLSSEYSLDAGVTWIGWPGSINLGTIAAGASVTVLIRGVVDPSCTGTITNTATVDSITPDPDPSNNTSTVDTTINTSADISVVKSDNPDPVVAGETLTYTMVVANAGPSDALDVVLSDAIPACVLSPEYSLDGGITWIAWIGSINLGTIAAGDSVTVLIRGSVDTSCSGTITNTATVDSITPDPNPNNNTSTVDTTITLSADISVVKSYNPSPATAGETLTYTMVVGNAGPSDALDVVLSDAIPACVLNPEYSLDGGITWIGWTGSINLGTFVSGASVVVLIRGVLDSACTGNITNTAAVSSPTPDPNPNNNISTITTQVNTLADISVVKSGNPNPVIAGETLTYTMVVSNAGPSDALDVVLSDAIPACVLNPEYSLNGGTTWIAWTGSVNLGTIAAGAPSITVLIRGRVDPSCTVSITNTATVSSQTPDPNPNNNTSTITNQVNTSADISVVKSGNPNPVIAGETLTYTMTIGNAGPSDALNVTLTDIAPICILNPEYSVDGGLTWNPWIGSVNLGTVAVGDSVIVLMRGIVDPSCSGTIINTAIVNSSTPDPNPNNNISTITNQVNTSADISVVKSATPDPVIAGETLTYTMVVSNGGPSDALDVVLSDAIPACVLNPEYSLDGGLTWNPWLGSINLGTFEPGDSAMVLIRGRVDESCTGTITNTATVSSPTPDPNPNNNTSTVVTEIATLADLSIVKSANPVYLDRGDLVTYTLTINNAGPSDSLNVSLADAIPPEILNPIFSLDNGVTFNPWVSPYAIGTLLVGTTVTILIRGIVSNSAKGIITNTAVVSSTTPDPDPNNNTSSANVNVNYADLVAPGNFVKSVDKEFADIGDILTYTISVTNTGNVIANNVVVSDPIPNDTTLVPGSISASVPFTIGNPDVTVNLINGVAPNQTVTISFKVSVDRIPTPNPIPNTGTVNYTYTVDPARPNGATGSGNTNTVTTQVNHGEIPPTGPNAPTKGASKETSTPGDTITYTVIATNIGNVPINNVTIKDVVPVGTTFIPGSATVNGIPSEQDPNVGINAGTINPNGIAIVTFDVVVNDNAPSILMNNADIEYEYFVDPEEPPVKKQVTTNEVDVDVVRPSTLIVKSANRSGAVVGDIIRYTISVTNNGQIPLTNVIVKDPLTPELSYKGNLTINGVPAVGNIVAGINIGDLAIGETKTIAFDAEVISLPEDGEIENTSTVDYTYSVPGSTFSGSDNSNEHVVKVYDPKLQVTKSADKAAVKVGESFIYTIEVENTGDIEVNNVIVKDSLPPEFKVVDIKVEGVSVAGDIGVGVNIGTIVVGQTKVVTLTIEVLSDRSTTFKNVGVANGTAKPDPNFPPTPVSGSGTDPIGVDVYNPELTLTKSVDKEFAVVGDTLTYTIVAENTGDIPLGNVEFNNVLLYDILASNLAFIAGSVTVNGVSDPQSGIVEGINLGILDVGEKVVVTFKAKILSKENNPVENIATASFGYVNSGLPPQGGSSKSNIVKVNIEEPSLKIVKTSDVRDASLGDTITYTVTITNDGDIDARNVIFSDDLPKAVRLIRGSFKVNGEVINAVDLSKGVVIGDIAVGESVVIEYKVKVVGVNCEHTIDNIAKAKFRYVLEDGSSGIYEVSDSESARNRVEANIANFKQLSIDEYLQIPIEKPDMEGINHIDASIEIKSCHVIETVKAKSKEGQNITSYKLVVSGIMKQSLEYTACDAEQSVHSAHYDVPFSTFIVLPEDYVPGSKVEVKGVVEDIYHKVLDKRNFFKNVTALINVKICFGE